MLVTTGILIGRVLIELFKDIVPKTTENFKCLCTGINSLLAVHHVASCESHQVSVAMDIPENHDIIKM